MTGALIVGIVLALVSILAVLGLIIMLAAVATTFEGRRKQDRTTEWSDDA